MLEGTTVKTRRQKTAMKISSSIVLLLVVIGNTCINDVNSFSNDNQRLPRLGRLNHHCSMIPRSSLQKNNARFDLTFPNNHCHRSIPSLLQYATQCRCSSNGRNTGTTTTRLYNSVAASVATAASSSSISPIGWFYLVLLAIQFGCQPILTKKFAPNNLVRSTYVLAQDFVRFVSCCLLLVASGSWTSTIESWTIQSALLGAGIPSILYMIQNYCSLMAYQNLPPVTYNVLNQTKTLSAALCCYLIMRKKQSPIQLCSLGLLLLSALVVEKVVPVSKAFGGGLVSNIQSKKGQEESIENTESEDNDDMEKINDSKETEKKRIDDANQFYLGVIPVLLASFISGLAGALTQRALQINQRNPFLFSMELSVFSTIVLISSLILGSPDGKKIRDGQMMEGWTWKTWIPIITNACGGIVVGLVTKHAGAVRKGFALIFGLVLSGVLQSYFSGNVEDKISTEQITGGILASISLWMHSKFPPV